ncbi:MAG: 3-hydroxy-9,10-secoandrosta,3,5(10)-triene-9, 17-dione monooxygenase [Frankiales bacterium]|nr:3-hydroxy-9,10-secoandrosta,3,5(10)-triene-9, 17-dione monooxygenase [Frankiales bacterium]
MTTATAGSKVLAAVKDLLPGIAARADQAEADRRIPVETIAELKEAGVFRMLQPKRWGGLEASPVEFYEVIRTIAATCGSTGWVASVVGVHPWQLALFPDQAQQDVWGSDNGTLVSSSYAPTGKLTPVEGGWKATGRWSFSSGCDHCTWVLLGAMIMGEDGKPVDMVTILVPKGDYRIEDVWDVVGLRATGSNDIVIEDAFIPSHHALSFRDVAALSCPGHAENTAPLYKLPFGTVFAYTITTPIIGIATGAYDAHVERMKERVRISYGGQKVSGDSFAHVRVARAATDIDASWLQLERNLNEESRLADAGEEIPMELRLRARRDQVRATERCIDAIALLFKNSGGHSLKNGNPIERAWRDGNAGSVHAANDTERWLALYGKGAFGLPIEDAMV